MKKISLLILAFLGQIIFINGISMNIAHKKFVKSNGKNCQWMQMVNGHIDECAFCRDFPNSELPFLKIDLGDKYAVQYILLSEAKGCPSGMKYNSTDYLLKLSVKSNAAFHTATPCFRKSKLSDDIIEYSCSKYIKKSNFKYVWLYLGSDSTSTAISLSEIEVFATASVNKRNLAFGKKVYYGTHKLEVYSTKPTSGFGSYFDYEADWIYVNLETEYPIFKVVVQSITDKHEENAFDMFVVRLTNLTGSFLSFNIIKHLAFCNQYPYEAKIVMVVYCIRTNHLYNGVVVHKDLSRSKIMQMKLQSLEIYMKEYAPKANYLGCYKYKGTLHATLKKIQTVEECMIECQLIDMRFTYITIVNKCYCANAKEDGHSVSLAKCYQTCPIDKNPCGGYKLYSVYETNLAHLRNGTFAGCFSETSFITARFIPNVTMQTCLKYCEGYSSRFIALKGESCECVASYQGLLDCERDKNDPNLREVYRICHNPCVRPPNRCFNNSALIDSQNCASQRCIDGWGGDACVYRACNVDQYKCLGSCVETVAGDIILGDCMCPDGLVRAEIKSATCDIDKNECEEGVCGLMSYDCVNTYGSYICRCKDGFDTIEGTCRDRDECQELDVCLQSKTICLNQIGSYQCICEPGYIKKGDSCVKITSNQYRKTSFQIVRTMQVSIALAIFSFLVCIFVTINKTKLLMRREENRVQIQRFERKRDSEWML